jgi:retinol dehydrogenase 12
MKGATELDNQSKPLNGQVCLVTGATSGIGKVTAQALAGLGALVVIVGRNPAKTAAAVHQIKQQTGSATVESLLADLSSQSEIRRLAEQFKDRYQRLDVLVNDAGGMFFSRRESVDGIEMTFALNHLGYFLLTNLMLDVLKSSAPARIVNVASRSHVGATINFDDLQGRQHYGGMQAYGQSKLANLLFTYELARRLAAEGTMGVTVNALHPGFVATNIGAGNGGWLGGVVKRVINVGAISPERGAQTSIYLATSPEVKGVTGKYFVECKPVQSSAASYDQATARRLWEVSAQMTGLSAPV